MQGFCWTGPDNPSRLSSTWSNKSVLADVHRAGRRLHLGRYITFQTKLNASEHESTMCACRVGDRRACVCLSNPHPSYLTLLSTHKSNNVCCPCINISSIKSSKGINFVLLQLTDRQLHSQPRPLVHWLSSGLTTRHGHANSECKWKHVCQTADFWGRGRPTLALLDVGAAEDGQHSTGLRITPLGLKLNCKCSMFSTWSFGTFISSHCSADQSFSAYTLMLYVTFPPLQKLPLSRFRRVISQRTRQPRSSCSNATPKINICTVSNKRFIFLLTIQKTQAWTALR